MSSAAEVRQRQRAGGRPESPAGPGGPGAEPALSFALRFEAGQGVLALVRAPAESLARVDILELGIPDLRFPFDVTGGASRFQTHRLVLRRAHVRVDLDVLGRALQGRLTGASIQRLEIGPAGVYVAQPGGACVAFRVLVEPAGDPGTPSARDLRFRVADARAVGPVGLPASLAAARVAAFALRAAGSAVREDPDGLVLADPLRTLLKRLLCRNGWRLPSAGAVRLSDLVVEPGRASLSFSALEVGATDELGAPATVVGSPGIPAVLGDRAALEALEGLRLARTADARLRGGDLAGARRVLVDALAMDPQEPTLLLRLAELDAVDPARAEGALSFCADLAPRGGLTAACAKTIEATAHEVLGEPLLAADALEALANVDPDPRVRAAALLHAARLAESARPDRAFAFLSRVDRLRPGDAEPAERLFSLALALGRRADAERIFPRALATAADAAARAGLLARFGDALASRWDDPAAARQPLERALRIDPTNTAALESLATAVARMGEPARAVRILGRLADVRAGAGARAAAARAHLAAAELLAAVLADPVHAAARAREAAALDPPLADAHLLLGRLSAQLSRAEEAVVSLERYLEVAGDVGALAQVDALCLLGAVQLEQRADPQAALEVARRALGVRPGEPRALRLIEQALFLARDFGALAEHHEAAAELEPGRAVHHLRELARLSDVHLDDPLAALDAVRRAADLAAEDLSAHEELARLADRLGHRALRQRALERLAVLRPDPRGRADALAQLADLLLAVADVRGATTALASAAALAPDDPNIAGMLVAVRRRIGEPIALAEALERHATVLGVLGRRSEIHDLRVEAARAFARAGRLREAGTALRGAVAAVDRESPPPHPPGGRWAAAMLLLAEVEERRGAYPEARLAYAALREAGAGTPRAMLAEARVAEHLGDDVGAGALYEELLQAGDSRDAEGSASNSARWQALERLLTLHRRRDDSAAIAAVLERAAAIADDRVRRAELLYDAARVRQERLADAAGAERVLWQLATIAPPHAAGLRLLASLVEARGDHEALARVYERLVLAAAVPEASEDRAEVLLALATLYEGPLRDERRAKRAWELLLAEDPEHEPARLALARGSLSRGELSAAEEHYGRLAAVSTIAVVRGEASLRMGLLRRDAGDLAAAERHLGTALEVGQDPAAVLPALEDVYAHLDRPADQARVLELRTRSGDPEEARGALRRLALLYEGALQDPPRAASAIARLVLAEPADAHTLLWLARASAAAGDTTGKVDALHRAAALTTDPVAAADLLTDAALALGGDPSRIDRAMALLEEALDRDPGCVRAARILDARLEELGAHEARVRLFGRVAEAATDPVARAEARLARAAVRLEALDDPRGALEDAIAAAPERPVDSATLAARIARRLDDPAAEAAALASLLEVRRDAPADELRRARLRLASLLAGPLGSPEQAAEEMRTLLAFDPADSEAAEALTALLRAGDDPLAFAEHLLWRAGRAPDGAAFTSEAARALGRAAARAAHSGDEGRAITLLERSWALDPDDAVAETLDHLFEASGTVGPRLALLESRAEGQAPEAQRELLGRLAGRLPEPRAAELDARLAALGDGEAVSRQVTRMRTAGDKAGVVTLLAQAAMAAVAGPARVRALLSVADAAEDAADEEALEDALREAVLEDPSAPEPNDRLVSYRIARGDLPGAMVVLAQSEGFTEEPARKVLLLMRRAELHVRTGDDDSAIEALSRAMTLEPEDPEVQGSLEEAYRRAGRWHDLVALLAARTEELPPSSARAQLEMEISVLLEERLQDPLAASRVALRAASLPGTAEATMTAASRAADLAHASGDATLEAEALERLAGACPDDGRAAEALAMRAECLRRAGDSGGATEALRAALLRRPEHPRALFELGMIEHDDGRPAEACDLLERFLATAGARPEDPGSPGASGARGGDQLAAAQVVARCAETLGHAERARAALLRWIDLAPEDPTPHAIRASLELEAGDEALALASLDALVDRARDAPERFHALVDRARLWRERFAEPRRAARDLLAAAEIEPLVPADSSQPRRDRDVAETALALAVESESWQDAVRAAGLLLRRTEDPARLRELHEVRARLRMQRLGDAAGAAEDLLAATRADAGPPEEGLLVLLVDAALSAGRIDEAFEGLDALVARPRSSLDRAALCVRAAESAERAGRIDRAKAAYRRALELGAKEPSTVAARLARLLDPQAEREELRSILELQLATEGLESTDIESRAAVLRRLATLSLEANEDTSAERHLRALAEIAPSDPLAFGNLRRIYQRRGAWTALLELFRVRSTVPAERSERVGLLYDIGRLLQDNLGREADAAEAYREALALDPEHLPTLDALADLCFRRADFRAADSLYGRLGVRGMLPLDTLLVRRAECAERLGRSAEAMAHYRAALAGNPRNARASEALARLLVLAGELDEAIAELGRAVELCPTDEEERTAELRVLLGEALLKAGRPAEAEPPLRAAAAVLEGDAQPLLLLRDVYTQAERWRDVIDVFSRLSYLVTTPRARAELEFRIGEVHRLRLGDPQAAADHYARGYDIDPRHLPTLRRLVVRYSETGRHQDALDVFVELHRLDTSAARRPDVLWCAARAAAMLGDAAPVEAVLVAAASDAPADPGPLLALARLVAATDPARGREALSAARTAGATPEDLGRLARELAGDAAAAEVALASARAALSLRPADAGALAALAEHAECSGDADAARRARAVLAFVDPTAPRVGCEPPRVLGDLEREAHLDTSGRSPLATAILHARHAFRTGAGETTVPGSPIAADAEPGLQKSLARARLLVGGPDVELYLLDDPSATLTLQCGDLPRLLFGGGFAELPEAERLFLIARALVRVSTGEGLLDRVDPAEVLSRLRALRRALVGARVDDGVREALERSAASMSARERILVSQALDRGLEGATAEMVGEVIEALHLFAGRTALSATRDVTAAVTALARAENDGELPEDPDGRTETVRRSAALHDLVAFALTTPL
jgi:Tfp pilus assembly protein PilF